MEDYIMISQLNDFIFCPYSIYLHNIYMEASEEIYHTTPTLLIHRTLTQAKHISRHIGGTNFL